MTTPTETDPGVDEAVDRFLEARAAQGLPAGVVDAAAVARVAGVVVPLLAQALRPRRARARPS